ncbi:MAG: uracil-DNA glycosylase [Spirochaetales bacterium]|nr:uracil-DNA glycosylase [Spirochaetales bacterium]
MNSRRSELYRLLCLAEDYVLDGYRHEHPPLPQEPDGVRSPRGDAATSAPAGTAGSASSDAAGSGEAGAPGSLEALAREVLVCRKCALSQRRNHAVPGEGSPRPRVLLIGEAPGYEEDRGGRPFVGPAGQYLDKWLKAIELDRYGDCYITNIVKCRPPGNRDPLPGEVAACRPYLERQIDLLHPEAILTLGRLSTQLLTGRSAGIGALRGQVHAYRGIPLVGTYHPSAVLRNSDLRKPVWEDLKLLRSVLDGHEPHRGDA